MSATGIWIYLGYQSVQSKNNRISLPRIIDEREILNFDGKMKWTYSKQQHRHAIWEADVEPRQQHSPPIKNNGQINYSVSREQTLTIPRNKFAEEPGSELPADYFTHDESRHFVVEKGMEDSGRVFVLTRRQLGRAVGSDDNWVGTDKNRQRIKEAATAENSDFPDQLVPDQLDIASDTTDTAPRSSIPTQSMQPQQNKGTAMAVEILPNKSTVDDHLIAEIKKHRPDNMYFLEYSSGMGTKVIKTALAVGANVNLLLRYPSKNARWEVSESQADRIIQNVKRRLEDYADSEAADSGRWQLHVQFYYHPASLRARRIGNQRLCIGWYTFENRNSVDTGNKTGKKIRAKHVQGHNNPMLLAGADSDGYEHLNEMFEKCFFALWKQGVSVEEVCQNDYVEALTEWMNRKPRREQNVQKASRRSASDLFSHKEWMYEIVSSENHHEFFQGKTDESSGFR